jgi:hypothetical protein
MNGLRLPCLAKMAALQCRSHGKHRVLVVPVQQHGEPVRWQLSRADRVWVAEQEVEHGTGRRALAMGGFESAVFALSAVAAHNLFREREVGELGVEGVLLGKLVHSESQANK